LRENALIWDRPRVAYYRVYFSIRRQTWVVTLVCCRLPRPSCNEIPDFVHRSPIRPLGPLGFNSPNIAQTTRPSRRKDGRESIYARCFCALPPWIYSWFQILSVFSFLNFPLHQSGPGPALSSRKVRERTHARTSGLRRIVVRRCPSRNPALLLLSSKGEGPGTWPVATT